MDETSAPLKPEEVFPRASDVIVYRVNPATGQREYVRTERALNDSELRAILVAKARRRRR